jgi:tetratricopeptide (TPR) repeat protein
MRRAGGLPLVLASAFACTGPTASPPSPSAPRVTPPPAAAPTPAATEWSWPNERTWIVAVTSRDVVEMILYARDKALAADDALRFSLAAEPGAATDVPRFALSFEAGGRRQLALSFPDHLWSPASYEPLAAGLIRDLGLKGAPAPSDGRVLSVLLDARSPVLERESQRVSRGLAAQMLQPALHEEAALVLGTLALREDAASRFSDTRHTLCRIASHLAVARALREGSASALADYGDALLLTLVNRQRDALEQVRLLEESSPPPALGPWLRVLRVHNTADWRILKRPARASLLERLEHFRALQRSLGGSQATAFLEGFKAEPMGDWGRIALARGMTVEQGHVFSRSVTGLDLKDAGETWAAFHGAPLPPEKLAQALNARPERLIAAGPDGTARPRVIGWGLWARYFQRNLCFDAVGTTEFIDSTLGLGQEAMTRQAELSDRFSGLDLWPRVSLQERIVGLPPNLKEAMAQAEARRKERCLRVDEMIQRTPELVPPEALFMAPALCNAALPATSAQLLVRRWLDLPVPAGTVMTNAESRLALLAPGPEKERVLAELRARAPFDQPLIWITTPPQRVVPFAELAALYGPLAEYSLPAMAQLASAQHDPQLACPLHERMARWEPDRNLALGECLIDLGEEARAVRAFEAAIAQARDRVAVSAGVMWLVGHYLETGREGRARQVAEMAAEVGSATGLATMGYLMERLGRYDEAAEWYRGIANRYEDATGWLNWFLVRYLRSVGDRRFGLEGQTALSGLFPFGFEKVTLAELKTAPLEMPVRVTGRYSRSTRFGLREGDVVIALNGYRVRSDEQYQCLWTLDDAPEATVIVWRDGSYQEIKGRMNDLRYGSIRPRRV